MFSCTYISLIVLVNGMLGSNSASSLCHPVGARMELVQRVGIWDHEKKKLNSVDHKRTTKRVIVYYLSPDPESNKGPLSRHLDYHFVGQAGACQVPSGG
jgi:hypothetical protein